MVFKNYIFFGVFYQLIFGHMCVGKKETKFILTRKYFEECWDQLVIQNSFCNRDQLKLNHIDYCQSLFSHIVFAVE